MSNPSGPPTAFDSITVAGVPTMGVAGVPMTTGNYWFVNSVSGSNGNTGAANNPFATLAQALLKAASGDVVVLEAGHAENVATAGAITVSAAGITIVGLGEGATRPTFTFTATAGSILVTGASCSISNVVGTGSVASCANPFNIQAADCTLNIEWRDSTAAHDAVRAILCSAAATRFICNLVYRGFTTSTHVVNAIRLVGVAGATINIDAYGIASTAWIEFVTTACTNVLISGYFYNSGTTDFSKNVVDTITGSTWYANGYDGGAGQAFDGGSGNAIAGSDVSAVIANQAVPAKDAGTNALERDVIGNKTDTAIYAPTNTNSISAYLKGNADLQEGVAVTAAAVISNALALFTIAGGPIEILELFSICQTANSATASTLQFSSSGTLGATTQTISGASATLANAAAGTSVIAQLTALATAPTVNVNGAGISATPGGIVVPAGSITAVVGVGSTTGTWIHYLRYRPLAKGVTVVNAF